MANIASDAKAISKLYRDPVALCEDAPPTIADALDCAAESACGVVFYSSRGMPERAMTYRELRDEAIATAGRLAAMGFRKGERLGLIAETGPAFLLVFYACQYLGLVPCPLPLTLYPGGKDAYVRRIAMLAAAARVTAIVTPSGLAECGREAAIAAVTRNLTYDDIQSVLPVEIAPARPSAGDPAYIQYSSGSTADPKGILITQQAVCTNAQSIVRNGLKLRSDDRAFSWLPFYHDMGLVGFSIAPLFGPCSVDYISPSTFARRPGLWLELMSANSTTITYSPIFGYRLAAQRYGGITGPVDLSRLRVAGIGGDMINADVLDAFAEAAGKAGFRKSAFLPSYGMAEAVLAVTFADLDAPPTIESPKGLSGRYVVCGRPLPEVELLVADENGVEVAELGVGHIWLRGPSIIQGYFSNLEATRAIRRRDGFIDTGDLGYLTGGNVVITGRSKDLMLMNGRNIWSQDIEWAAERVSPLKSGDTAAFGVEDENGEKLVVLVQCSLTEQEARDDLRQRVAAAIVEATGASASVVFVSPRSLPFTSSGKLARAKAKETYLRAKNEQAAEGAGTRDREVQNNFSDR